MLPALSKELREKILSRDSYSCCIQGCSVSYTSRGSDYLENENYLALDVRLEVHHVQGRRTKLDGVPDNRPHRLATLCGYHHKLLHGQARKPGEKRTGLSIKLEAIQYAEQFSAEPDEEYQKLMDDFAIWYANRHAALIKRTRSHQKRVREIFRSRYPMKNAHINYQAPPPLDDKGTEI